MIRGYERRRFRTGNNSFVSPFQGFYDSYRFIPRATPSLFYTKGRVICRNTGKTWACSIPVFTPKALWIPAPGCPEERSDEGLPGVGDRRGIQLRRSCGLTSRRSPALNRDRIDFRNQLAEEIHNLFEVGLVHVRLPRVGRRRCAPKANPGLKCATSSRLTIAPNAPKSAAFSTLDFRVAVAVAPGHLDLCRTTRTTPWEMIRHKS